MAKTQDITFDEYIPGFKWHQPQIYDWPDFGVSERRYAIGEHYRRPTAEVEKEVTGLKYHHEPMAYGVYEIKFDVPEQLIRFIAPQDIWESRSGFLEKDTMRPLDDAIESSRTILDIQDNWDNEGSRGYSEETWHRATSFVRDIAARFFNTTTRFRIEPPTITPGPDGSIDVRWVSPKRSILINFPADENASADFFGHDKGQDVIKGTLDLASQNHWLLLWLTR